MYNLVNFLRYQEKSGLVKLIEILFVSFPMQVYIVTFFCLTSCRAIGQYLFIFMK